MNQLLILNNDRVMRCHLLCIVLLQLLTAMKGERDVPESTRSNEEANNRIRLAYATIETYLLLHISCLIITALIILNATTLSSDIFIKVTSIERSWKEGMST